MANFKLGVLRLSAIAALKVAYLVKGQDRYRWLLHYLQGSGETLHVPAQHMEAMVSTMARVWAWALEDQDETLVKRWSGETQAGSRIGFWSTTLYQGRGFGNRPEPFYLLGCFTYTVKHWRDQGTGKDVVTVCGADWYDWHDNGEGQWYTSPTPRWFAQIMNWIFGEEYFPISGFPMGEPGISNRLWADFARVGAKPFKTRFQITVTKEEWWRLAYPDDEE